MSTDTKTEDLTYKIGRKEASEFLSVTTRTLDRYIRNGKVSSRYSNGRIWLSKEELAGLKQEREGEFVNVIDRDLLSSTSIDDDRKKEDTGAHSVQTEDSKINISSTPRSISNAQIFEKLHNELKKDIKQKQERLEVANYRVGQLEAQLRNTIPMLEYHRENYKKKKIEEELRGKIHQASAVINKLNVRLEHQKMIKRVFLATLVIILALQPIWLLIHFNNFF